MLEERAWGDSEGTWTGAIAGGVILRGPFNLCPGSAFAIYLAPCLVLVHCHMLNTNADTDSGLDDPSSFHPGGANILFARWLGPLPEKHHAATRGSTPTAPLVIHRRAWFSRRSARAPAARSSVAIRIESQQKGILAPMRPLNRRLIFVIVATALAFASGCGGEPRGPVLAGGREVKSWLAALHDPKPRVRREAVLKLGNVG